MKKGDIRLNEIYEYIKGFANDNGFPPSVREIAQRFSIKSTSTVHYYLEKLRENGMIVSEANKKRAVVFPGQAQQTYVPLVGKVSAGQGILAVENIEGEFPLPQDFFHGKNLFMLRVDGNSMIKAGISDGDFVVVRKQESVDTGEIGVVFWQGNATIKRIKSVHPTLVLHPENDAMDDIVILPEDCPSILGKVIGCIKQF